MTIDRRCKATFTRSSGQVLRCEHYSGHDSVHYNGDVWWPNKSGFPMRGSARAVGIVGLAWMIAVAVVLAAVIVYLALR